MRVDNPQAIFVRCDAAMNYDSKNTGGIGYFIEFPEECGKSNISRVVGRYEGTNIERLELNALILGLTELLRFLKKFPEVLDSVTEIICVTDRYSLSDTEKTNPWKLQAYRKNGWKNHEGKEIKNKDFLDKIDKLRQKTYRETRLVPKIHFRPRKENKTADNLSKQGKKRAIVEKSIARPGIKMGVRKFDGEEVDYKYLKQGQGLEVHIFKKELIREQWEISAEIVKGELLGQKLKIYTDSKLEKSLHRRHKHSILLKEVFMHHIHIEETTEDHGSLKL